MSECPLSTQFQTFSFAHVAPESRQSAIRHALAALTERLFDVLDSTTPFPDLEDDDPHAQFNEDGMNTAHGNFLMHGNSFEGSDCNVSDGGT